MDPDTPLASVEFTAFDLETTGLEPDWCRIVEFGAVRFLLEGAERDRFEQLVDPQCSIPKSVIRIHGITDGMVRGQPSEEEVLPDFLAFLAAGRTILLAHHAPFDMGFLGFALRRTGLAFPDRPVVDTLDLARSCLPGLYRHRLVDLAVRLRVAEMEDHRALSDACLVMGVFRKMVARTAGLRTVGDLFRLTRPLNGPGSGGSATAPAPDYELLAMAIEEERTVVMVYEGGTKGRTQRRITPRTILRTGRYPYLIAYCHRDGIEKTFRLDRIRGLRIDEG